MIRRSLVAAVLLTVLLAAAIASAQNPFALTNIGVDLRSTDARIDGRGGWGLAERDTLLPSFHNIASLPGLTKLAVVMSGYGEQSDAEDASGTRMSSNVRTPSLSTALPFKGGRGVFSAGFRSLRGTQYSWVEEFSITLTDPDDTDTTEDLDGLRTFEREGTQFEVPIGLSWRLDKRLAVGASINLVHGVIKERMSEGFFDNEDDGNLPLRSNSEVIEDDLSGVSTTYSALLSLHERVQVGATYTAAHNWDMTRTRDMNSIPGNVIQNYEVRIPARWAVGATLGLDKRWRAGFEYESQAFSGLSGRIDWESSMVDSWSISAGLERVEAFKRRGGTGNLPLRAGFSLSRLPYTLNGNEVDEKRFSVGSGVPLRDGNGHLDVALSYIMTGALEDHGVQDRAWRLTVSLAGLEKWW
jgi:hypothetical protein